MGKLETMRIGKCDVCGKDEVMTVLCMGIDWRCIDCDEEATEELLNEEQMINEDAMEYDRVGYNYEQEDFNDD
jgi:hypothetical protein